MRGRASHLVDFAVSVDHRMNMKEREKKQVFCCCKRAEKTAEPESDCDTNYSWRTNNCFQRHGKKLKKLETKGRIETIRTTALQKSAKILRRILVARGKLLSLRLL